MNDFFIDSHKLLWHLDRLNDWNNNKLISPIYTEVSLTNVCNHHCIFCGVDFAKGKQFIDTNVLKKAISGMARADVKSIMFAGEGEPLLHKQFYEIVEHTYINDINTAIATNGSVNNKVLCDTIPFLSFLRFSFNAGLSSTYQYIHKTTKEMFSITTKNIKNVVDTRNSNNTKCQITMQFVVLNENKEDIHNFIHLANDLGVDLAIIKPYSRHPLSTNGIDIEYTKEDIEKIELLANEHKNVIFRKDSFVSYINKNITEHCWALPFWAYISSKGDFYTCSVHLGDDNYCAGNIYNDSIDTILFGEKRLKAINNDCAKYRINCRMAKANVFLSMLKDKPEFVNFI